MSPEQDIGPTKVHRGQVRFTVTGGDPEAGFANAREFNIRQLTDVLP
jgi:hypothetical protein